MSIIVSNMNMPSGCQQCKFFKKLLFGNGLDYSYSCILGAKDFPMPWIRQMEERASDCPIEPLKQKTGHWIKNKDGYHRCSECGSRGSAIKARYCHHCGARMESEGKG